MNSIKNIARKDLMKKNKYEYNNEIDKELFELLKNSDTLVGASMRARVLFIELLKEIGVEKLMIYCASILNKLITKITNIHKSLTKH